MFCYYLSRFLTILRLPWFALVRMTSFHGNGTSVAITAYEPRLSAVAYNKCMNNFQHKSTRLNLFHCLPPPFSRCHTRHLLKTADKITDIFKSAFKTNFHHGFGRVLQHFLRPFHPVSNQVLYRRHAGNFPKKRTQIL